MLGKGEEAGQDFVPVARLFSHPLNGPFLLAQRATITLLHPERHAAVVERMVALSPNDHAVLLPTVEVLLALRLAPQTRVHHLNAANRAGVALHVPAPHGHGVPFLQDKQLVRFHVVVIATITEILLRVSHLNFLG